MKRSPAYTMRLRALQDSNVTLDLQAVVHERRLRTRSCLVRLFSLLNAAMSRYFRTVCSSLQAALEPAELLIS